MARVRTRVLVSGRVQGVWFRGSTQDRARELGLSGWARNLRDGRVEAVFEGEEEAVRAAVEYVREGPPHSRVSGVEVHDEAPLGDSGDFEIRRG